MAYKVIVSPRAQKEIENAIDYYALYSADTPQNFIKSLEDAFDALSKKPFFRVRYKNIRGLMIKRFPYTLYFMITEHTNRVRILSCFHNKRNPDKRPRV